MCTNVFVCPDTMRKNNVLSLQLIKCSVRNGKRKHFQKHKFFENKNVFFFVFFRPQWEGKSLSGVQELDIYLKKLIRL